MKKDVYIAGACRTAVGGFGGTLSNTPLTDLGAAAMKEAMKRAGVTGEQVDESIMGCVIQAGHELDPARVAHLAAGIQVPSASWTINMACASGLKAVSSAAQAIEVDQSNVVVAGGMESMNRAPYALMKARTGYRMGHDKIVDLMVNGLTCPINSIHMGNTAEEIAKRHEISREAQDEFAFNSYQKALKAQEDGKFKEEIFPFEVPQRKGDPIVFDKDEDPKPTPMEVLQKLRPAFVKDGTVTAGNASNIDDGGAACVVLSEQGLKDCNVTPMAKIVGYADAGVDPLVMGLGPAEAVPKALAHAGWKYDDVDLYELNEAFAAQSLGVLKLRPEINPELVNVHGGAIALGHPVGASGMRILATLLYALKDRGKKRGVASLCVGTGMGIAMCVELV